MSEWKVSTLQDLIVLLKDGTHGTHKDFPNGIPMLSAKDILNGRILIPDDARTISENDYKSIHSTYEITEDDILLTIVGTIGRCAIVKKNKKKFTLQRSVGIIRVNKNTVSPDYIYNYFQSKEFQSELEKSINASAQGGIYLGKLGKIEISYPVSLSEQSKIATRLSSINIAIEKTKSTIAKYKAIKQGILHDLFTRGIDMQTGKLRPKYEDAPELYKASELGMLPKDWRKGQLIDCANKNDSHSFTGGPFGSDLQTKHYTTAGVRIIQLQNIGDGVFNNKYKIYTSAEKADFLFNCNIFAGDIIIAKMADPIARACIIPTLEKRYLMASDGIRLAVDKKKFNSKFIMEIINHNRFRTIAELKATGSTRARIGLTELREIAICYPDKGEQDMIAQRLNTIDTKIQSEQAYLQKLQKIKTGLMNDLLTGKKKISIAES